MKYCSNKEIDALICSGQQFPDTELSFSSATAGGTKPLC